MFLDWIKKNVIITSSTNEWSESQTVHLDGFKNISALPRNSTDLFKGA